MSAQALTAEPALGWRVLARDGEARAGFLRTRRGVVETPVFMPVGTLGSVKGVRFEELEAPDLDASIILGNTYHLWLRPGAEVLRACGGLHKFIGWERAILTDSGGFQVFSLSDLRRISEEGVEFRSQVDGRLCFLSPEVSMEVQAALGSDIVMAFDECLAGQATHDAARASLELTARWARRSRTRFDELQREGADTGRTERTDAGPVARNDGEPVARSDEELVAGGDEDGLSGRQAVFGIVQGATHLDLRRESLERTVEVGFDGYAIGGLSVGEEKRLMYEVVEAVAPLMPAESPRYLMGVGTPEDLVESVARGVDMFDCVMPTRNGRNGQAFTSRGKLNIKNARWAADARPLDDACACAVCRRHSRAYLRHLFMSGEMLAAVLLSHHNLAFFLDTMRRVRQAIRSGEFTRFRREFLVGTGSGVE
ncbi:MAG TPA: tRNA guanosine(34) transglycosylase Tgt [Pyrinomonadaceae bacterium]|jgi:queuine tRNA-ribosyltransferase|nr:tRNA guanosine(34) transglycosylase Tgt [Pyrinomonadaceae bacterium]